MSGPLQARPSCLCRYLPQAVGPHGSSLPCVAPRAASREAIPLVDEGAEVTPHCTSYSPYQGVAQLLSTPFNVARPRLSPEQGEHGCDPPSPYDHDGRINDRLGRGLRRQTGERGVEGRVPLLAYKLPGTQGCLPGFEVFSPRSRGVSYHSQDGQYGGCVPHKPPRRFKVAYPGQASRRAASWGSDVELEEMESEQTGLAFSLPSSPERARANSPVEFLHDFLFPSPKARDFVSFGLDDVLHTAASDYEDFGPALADALPPSGQEARKNRNISKKLLIDLHFNESNHYLIPYQSARFLSPSFLLYR